jgi:Amt family ammonium transporter
MYTREILSQAGLACDSVANGALAVAAVQAERYDVVLMDCHMPEMDGFEATRRIRRLEREGATPGRVSIVALTGNAMQGDREQCLEAGMDDHLGKPIQAAELIELIERLLIGNVGPEATRRPRCEARPDENDTTPINADVLLERCLGDVEFATSLLDEMRTTWLDRVDEIARHAANRDTAAAAEAAHALKGAAGTLAAEPLQALTGAIEAAGKSGDADLLASAVDALRREIRECLDFAPIIRERMMAK